MGPIFFLRCIMVYLFMPVGSWVTIYCGKFWVSLRSNGCPSLCSRDNHPLELRSCHFMYPPGGEKIFIPDRVEKKWHYIITWPSVLTHVEKPWFTDPSLFADLLIKYVLYAEITYWSVFVSKMKDLYILMK